MGDKVWARERKEPLDIKTHYCCEKLCLKVRGVSVHPLKVLLTHQQNADLGVLRYLFYFIPRFLIFMI